MNAYMVRHTEDELPTDEFAVMVFAPIAVQAEEIAATRTDMCEHPREDLRATRMRAADDPTVVERREATLYEYRAAGFIDEDSPRCDSCDKCSFDIDEYAVCDECHQCRECGCDDECTTK